MGKNINAEASTFVGTIRTLHIRAKRLRKEKSNTPSDLVLALDTPPWGTWQVPTTSLAAAAGCVPSKVSYSRLSGPRVELLLPNMTRTQLPQLL